MSLVYNLSRPPFYLFTHVNISSISGKVFCLRLENFERDKTLLCAYIQLVCIGQTLFTATGSAINNVFLYLPFQSNLETDII